MVKKQDRNKYIHLDIHASGIDDHERYFYLKIIQTKMHSTGRSFTMSDVLAHYY